MPGGSSQPNGPNQRARDAARDAGLSKQQQEKLQRELEKQRENLTYKEIKEMADSIKKGG